jgi:O-antigen/teichoic acid export membrane protein
MINSINEFKSRHMKDGSFVSSALTLMTGTAIAQAITVLISPVLTRLYNPVDYGVFALYVALSSVISIFTTGRYENVIVTAKDDDSAVNILVLCISITAIMSTAVFIIFFLFNHFFTHLIGNDKISVWLYFVPVTMLFTGAYNTFTYWGNRKKKFKILAQNCVLLVSVTVVLNLGIGFSAWNTKGLILSYIIGQAIATFSLGYLIRNDIMGHVRAISLKRMKNEAVVHRAFPLFALPADLINTFSNQLPLFLFSHWFGAVIVGLFSLTQRVLGTPITIIAKAITDVFKQRASSDYNQNGNCRPIYVKTIKTLFFAAIFPSLFLLLGAPSIFSVIFGEKWKMSGEFTQILVAMYFLKFISSPLSYTFFIAKKQKEDFYWHLYLGISTFLILLMSYYLFKDVKHTLIVFSINFSIIYIIYIIRSYTFSKALARGINVQVL